MTEKKENGKLFDILDQSESEKDAFFEPLDSCYVRWTKDITPTPCGPPQKDKYHEFFRKVFEETFDPLCFQDFLVDGGIRCIIYIPEDLTDPNSKDIRFYIKKSFEKADNHLTLFPSYLPFVKVVINSETSIDKSLYPTLRETMVKKTLDMLQHLSSLEGSSPEDKMNYRICWENFGGYIKIGCIEKTDYQKLMVPLLRFYSSKSLLEDDVIRLDEYVENMFQNQKQIYYLTVKSLDAAKGSPYLATHVEVLILHEILDKLLIQQVAAACEGFQFSDITKEDLREFTKGLSPDTFGITDNLRVFVNGLTPATFYTFPEQDELSEVSDLETTGKDLSEWQEGHVTLVLGSIRLISKLRSELCPQAMKERRFWRIYFTLVSTHVAPYERKYMEELRSNAESNKDEEAKKTPAVVGTETTDKNVAMSRTSNASSEQDDDSDEAPDLADDGDQSVADDFDKLGKSDI